jgi:SAM-dependent methyltransferase
VDLELPVPGMDVTIAPNDGMYLRTVPQVFAMANYLQSGRTALACIRAAQLVSGTGPVQRILDLPCGHGRVLRVLKAAYPAAELVACDIDHDGVNFCVSQFGATGVYSVADPHAIPIQGPFDLIWCGSLMTHFDAPRWPHFLQRFRSWLSATGVCVFTTHGVGAVEYLEHGRFNYGVANPLELLKRYHREGFAYQSYADNRAYGVSLTSIAWVTNQIAKLPRTRIVLVAEKGWHNHHDAIAFGPLPAPEWERVGV